MINESINEDIILALKDKYSTPDLQKNLRLNKDLIGEILEILENMNYKILPPPDFPTANFSATALDYFRVAIENWVNNDDEIFSISSEQILRELITQGWFIYPPKGV